MDNEKLSREELKSILDGMDNAKIALIGDLCLDMYWTADMRLSELSRETPHYPLPIVGERYAPGGAGNAADNIAALKPAQLSVVGLVGDDWRGALLLKSLEERGIDCSRIVKQSGHMTNAYIKPLRSGISHVIYEDPRLDFENRAPISSECEEKILNMLESAAKEADVICVSDQMKYGCVTPAVRKHLCELGRLGKTVIVDSRDHGADYRYVTVKPNEVEAARAFGNGTERELPELSRLAEQISLKNERVTLVTLGDKGCFVAENGKAVRCPACPVEPPIDFCGAGDTFMSGYATALAGGADPINAARTAALCSAVTIKKLGATGSASREEVLAAWELYFGNSKQ